MMIVKLRFKNVYINFKFMLKFIFEQFIILINHNKIYIIILFLILYLKKNIYKKIFMNFKNLK